MCPVSTMLSTYRILLFLGLISPLCGQEYLGCFGDRIDRVLPTKVNIPRRTTTVELCIGSCKESHAATYAGVEYGVECWCGNSSSYARYGKRNELECNMTCSGNSSQICGGGNRINIYAVCDQGQYSDPNSDEGNCDYTCYCENRGICNYSTGQCPGHCVTGWTGDSCQFLDCQHDNGGCTHNCTSGMRQDACSCLAGYYKRGRTCMDINECEKRNHRCNQVCVNTDGSYQCDCNGGYHLDDAGNCTDTNECEEDNHRCNQVCVNTNGSYQCDCNDGYHFDDAGNCTDINECEQDNHRCNQVCLNTIGSYQCDCNDGYHLDDGGNCRDINECEQDKHRCNQVCLNTNGSYQCDCHEGYHFDDGDHHACIVVSTGSSIPVIAGGSVAAAAVVVIVLIIICGIVVCKKRSAVAAKDENRLSMNATNSAYSEDSETEEKSAPIPSRSQSPVAIKQKKTISNPVYSNMHSNYIPITKLKPYVEGILECNKRLQAEYENVPTSYGTCIHAKKAELKLKNKYKNILPYDDNTVILKETGEPHSDYINASYIKFPGEVDTAIAAQGPTPDSVSDFWRMIWEQDVPTIVMLANVVEDTKRKCAHYWPDEGEVQHGDIIIQVDGINQFPDFTIRTFKIRIVRGRWQCKDCASLPLHVMARQTVPDQVAPLLRFHRKVCTACVPGRPLVVHCSAGVGRTGTYIALGRLVRQAEKTTGADFVQCLQQMREQRMEMIQTLTQYTFLHVAVLDCITVGDTSIPVRGFSALYANLPSVISPIDLSYLQGQFEVLGRIPALTNATASAGHHSKNKAKNRTDILPSDEYRVMLMSGRSDYINAVWVAGYKRNNEFIVTQWPLVTTVEDIWKMIIDYDVTTVIVLEDMSSETGYPVFWPTKDKDISVGGTRVSCGGDTESKAIKTTVVAISSKTDDTTRGGTYLNAKRLTSARTGHHDADERRVCLLRLPANSSPLDVMQVSTLNKEMISSQSTTSPIVVMSRDGGVLCGQYLALSVLITMAQQEQNVDLFYIVHKIKTNRPEFFVSEESYQELFRQAERYCG